MNHPIKRPLLLIQMGMPPENLHAIAGDQSDWFRKALADTGAVQLARPFLEEPLPDPEDVSGAIITGSWAMVTDKEDWSERTAAWIRQAVKQHLPLLGVCYGHQLMSHALGGTVDYHPAGREIGLQSVQLQRAARNDWLLQPLPEQFGANLTHEQSVLEPPANAQVLAGSAHDPHQILRYNDHAWSVQFHPEFDADLMTTIIKLQSPLLESEGRDVGKLLSQVQDTPQARRILLRFAQRYAG